MPSPLVIISISISIIVITLGHVSAHPPGASSGIKKSPSIFLGLGYKCDQVFFSSDYLWKVIGNIMYNIHYNWIPIDFYGRKHLTYTYDGPPFMQKYHIWPISLNTGSYDEALCEPYRVVLTDNLEVFSVISMQQQGVKECLLMDEVSQEHVRHNFRCLKDTFTFQHIQPAIDAACQKILRVATERFPARYNGSHFAHLDEQRYIYTINIRGAYDGKSDPGPHRLVMNSSCKLLGTITTYRNNEVGPCLDMGASKELPI